MPHMLPPSRSWQSQQNNDGHRVRQPQQTSSTPNSYSCVIDFGLFCVTRMGVQRKRH